MPCSNSFLKFLCRYAEAAENDAERARAALGLEQAAAAGKVPSTHSSWFFFFFYTLALSHSRTLARATLAEVSAPVHVIHDID